MSELDEAKSLMDEMSVAIPAGYKLFCHAGFRGGVLMLVNSNTQEIVHETTSFQVDGGDPGVRVEGGREYLNL